MGGHAQPVSCLCISGPWLFSADFGGTIKVWSLAQGSLAQTLEKAHSDARVPAITHLLVCDSHLVSAALDGRLKVWTPVEGGAGAGAVVAETPAFVWPELEAVQQGKRGGRGAPPPLAGILAVQGVTDPEGKALLAVSFNGEKCVRLFEWPTFNDRGTFAEVVNARGMAAIGQFFVAGDERGKIKVWRYKAAAQSRAADASVGAF
ncbi:hypothetical protein H632_c1115p0 [Helicosporidium sp. ATCC 50920]|nr:hypothetical protein H632_c1115p0 [Helicosporidium sp. ATCC 50920]|eukprot:KDD74717.1 hypothetical protein H632_c1115p0 [Helicosporidium sp. ATCC 50920]